MSNASMSRMMLAMNRFERAEHAAQFAEVKRPVHDYDDPERFNALWRRIEDAQRFTWPSTLQFNV